MKKKQLENKINVIIPSINYTSPNETQQVQIKGIVNRSKTPFYRKKTSFSPEEENLSSGTLNKNINNQTFIYNSINFNNQGLFNNINNTNNNHYQKKRKSGGNAYLVNNGILNLFGTMKKSKSSSKQKNRNNKYLNIINKLTNTPFFYKSINKHKYKSNSKQKNNSFKNEKKKINNTLMNTNHNINPSHFNNTNTLQKKNKHKLSNTNNNFNTNLNVANMINYNNKINHILASSTSKNKKVKKNTDINLTNKNTNTNKNRINLIKNIQFIDSDRNKEIKKLIYPEENINISEYEKKILNQIESLIFLLLTNGSSPKNILVKEIESILKNTITKLKTNNKLENNVNKQGTKKLKNNLYFSKNGSKNNLIAEPKNKSKGQSAIKDNFEQELNLLNKKYNQIKEENINLKYLITEKTTAYDDIKNSLKNFQLEINQLKTIKENNIFEQNPNSLRIKNEDYNIDNSLAGNISLNSKGVEMKNIKLNLSNIQKLNEIQGQKKEPQEKNTDANTNKEINNIFNCNNYSFGQNNSFEINLENYNSSQKNFLNSNRSLDPLSLTFHEQTINAEGGEEEKNTEKEKIEYDFSPSMRKNAEILIRTGILP